MSTNINFLILISTIRSHNKPNSFVQVSYQLAVRQERKGKGLKVNIFPDLYYDSLKTLNITIDLKAVFLIMSLDIIKRFLNY